MPTPIIELANVSFRFGRELVLDDISLRINPGDYLGVIGPNGGGKTTFIRLIVGLLNPDKGAVGLWGEPARRFRAWHKLGYVPQRTQHSDFRLPISVEEVVGFGARHKTDVRSALKHVGLALLAKRRLSELSGGQQQKVFIAKALAARPEVLILDEPTVGVDLKAQDEFYQLVARLNKKDGLTIIMVSHDIDVVVNEVSKLACINKQLVYHGRPKEFMEKDYLAKLYGKTRKLILHGHV